MIHTCWAPAWVEASDMQRVNADKSFDLERAQWTNAISQQQRLFETTLGQLPVGIVVYREGVDYSALREKLPPELSARLAPLGARPHDEVAENQTIFWAGNAPVTISSTWIRGALPSVQSLSESLPPAVERYARRHRLYVAP